MDRAYAVLTNKSFHEDGDFVVIKGVASTPSTDRMGDIVEPMGAKFALPMKLLMQHDHGAPVGNVTFAKPSQKGIPFEARLPRVSEPGRIKDRVDEAIHSLKYDLISAVSIGFRAVADQVERLNDGGLRFKEWEWLELSLVTIPANSEAVITAIKSADDSYRRAAEPEFSKGDRVVALADHMEGMKGSEGVISIVKNGPYYGVTFDGETEVHKWLAQSEVEPAPSETASPKKPKKPKKPMKPMGSMKSADRQQLSASGSEPPATDPAPGDTGATPKPRGPVYLKAPPRKNQPVKIIIN